MSVVRIIARSRWPGRARGASATVLVMVLAFAWACSTVLAPPAHADPGHAAHAGQPVVVTQSVGPYVLRVRITPPGAETGIVVLDVDAPEQPPGDAVVDVSAVRVGSAQAAFTGRTGVAAGDPGPYSFRFPADAPGAWELRLVAVGEDGRGTASVPFGVLAPPPSALETAFVVALVGTGAAVAVLVLAVATTRVGRPRRRTRTGATLAVLVGLTAVVTLGVQVVLVPAAARVAAPVAGDRPPAQLLMERAPTAVGDARRLAFVLVDGYTGRPVDDLVPHHEALVHLVVRDAAGFLAHLHPARVAPGRFVVDLTIRSPGRHTVLAETTRSGSGGQVLRAAFTVPGEPGPAAPEPPLVGLHGVPGGPDVTAGASVRPAGQATSLRFRLARGGVPVDGIDPWLGMPGHLLVGGPTGSDDVEPAVFGHVHAAGPMPVEGAPATRSVGPDIAFTYTFPRPGRYEVWLQFLDGRSVRTVAGHLDIPGTTTPDTEVTP